MSQQPIQDDPPQVAEDVQDFLVLFFGNGGPRPTLDEDFIDQARQCQYDQSKWDKFIEQNISLRDRESLRLKLKEWIAKATNTEPIKQDLSTAYNQVLSSTLLVKEIRQPELNDQQLKELDAQVRKRLLTAIQSKIFIEFLKGQFGFILKILQDRGSLFQYFKELKMSILGKHDLPLYNLFNEMTFTDFLILLLSVQKSSYKISKYLLFDQRTQTPIIYEAYPDAISFKQDFIKYVLTLIEKEQYVLIINFGSQRTRRSGKTQFLTKLVDLNEHYIEQSSFPNNVNLYSKFKFSNENRLILADFNGAYNKESEAYLRDFVKMASVLILHLHEDDLSEDNILKQTHFENLLIGKKWERIIILVRDFEKTTEKYLRSKVPQSLKDKVKFCCLPNFERPPQGLKRSTISELQNKALEAFRDWISTMEKVERNRKTNEELLAIYDKKKSSFAIRVQEKCQKLINEVKDWTVRKSNIGKENPIFNKLDQTRQSQSKTLFQEFKKQTSSIWKKLDDLLHFQKEIEGIAEKILVKSFVVCRRKIRITDNQFKTKADDIFRKLASEAQLMKKVQKDDSKIIDHYQANLKNQETIFISLKQAVWQKKLEDLIGPNISPQQKAQFDNYLNFYSKVNRANSVKDLFTGQNYAKISKEDRLKIQRILNQDMQDFQPKLQLSILEKVMSNSSLYESMNDLLEIVQRQAQNAFLLMVKIFDSQLIKKVLNNLEKQRENLLSYLKGMLLTIARSQIQLRKTNEWSEAYDYFKKRTTAKELSLIFSLKNEEGAPQDDKTADSQEKAAQKIKRISQINAIQDSIKKVFSEYLVELNPSRMMNILEAQLAYPVNASKHQLKRLFKNYYKYLKNQNRYLLELLFKENAVTFRQDKISLIKQGYSTSYGLRISEIIETLQKKDIGKIKEIFEDARISTSYEKDKIEKYVGSIIQIIKRKIPNLSASDTQISQLIDSHILNDFKNAAIGCSQQCPVCGVKCILPYNHLGDHKAKENSHQLIAFAGVTDRLSKEFNFFICQSSPLMNKRLWHFQQGQEKTIVKTNYKNAKQLISSVQVLWNSDFPNNTDRQYHQNTDKLEFYKMIWANIETVMITTKYRQIIPDVKQSTDPAIMKYKLQNTFLTYSDLQEIEVDPFTEEDYKLIAF